MTSMALASSFYISIILFYFCSVQFVEDANIKHDPLAKQLFKTQQTYYYFITYNVL